MEALIAFEMLTLHDFGCAGSGLSKIEEVAESIVLVLEGRLTGPAPAATTTFPSYFGSAVT